MSKALDFPLFSVAVQCRLQAKGASRVSSSSLCEISSSLRSDEGSTLPSREGWRWREGTFSSACEDLIPRTSWVAGWWDPPWRPSSGGPRSCCTRSVCSWGLVARSLSARGGWFLGFIKHGASDILRSVKVLLARGHRCWREHWPSLPGQLSFLGTLRLPSSFSRRCDSYYVSGGLSLLSAASRALGYTFL